jgi:hypothetical protein
MIKKSLFMFVITILSTTILFPSDYRGWGNIKTALEDGNGSEFVKKLKLPSYHFSSVEEAYNWVTSHFLYESDPNPPDIWKSSSVLYLDIILKNFCKGDCEDFSILLCALLRFHTSGGISDNKVWVAVGKVKYGIHAWVEYIDNNDIIWVLDPIDGIRTDSRISRFKFNDKWVIPLHDVKNCNIFNWGELKRHFPQEWKIKIYSPIIVILFSHLFIEFSTSSKIVYLFYLIFLSSVLYLIIILVG